MGWTLGLVIVGGMELKLKPWNLMKHQVLLQ